MRIPRAVAKPTIVAATSAGLLLAAGCTASGGHATTTPVGTVSRSSSSQAADTKAGYLPPGVTQHPLPTKVANVVAKRQAVDMTICRKTADGWEAGGTVRNSGDSARKYRITVFFTTTTATVLNYGQVTKTVPAGGRKTWTTRAAFKSPAVMDCALRGVG